MTDLLKEIFKTAKHLIALAVIGAGVIIFIIGIIAALVYLI